MLLETYAAAYDRFLRYQMVAVVFRGTVAAEQHAELLDCALMRDAERACRVLDAHVAGCVDMWCDARPAALRGGAAPCPRCRSRARAPIRTRPMSATIEAAETTGERAYRLIRADILRGTLAPGQKLKLDALRDTYDAGIGTLRETLSRLVAERLVVAEGQRGFEVAPFSATELRELAGLRLLLEGHALEQFFRAGDVEWEARVVAVHHKLSQMEDRLRDGDASALEPWRRFDAQLHQTLISACGSRTLMATHVAVFDRYQRYQNMALGFRGEIAQREHTALRDAALKRDAAAARAVLSVHILGGVDYALARGAV